MTSQEKWEQMQERKAKLPEVMRRPEVMRNRLVAACVREYVQGRQSMEESLAGAISLLVDAHNNDLEMILNHQEKLPNA